MRLKTRFKRWPSRVYLAVILVGSLYGVLGFYVLANIVPFNVPILNPVYPPYDREFGLFYPNFTGCVGQCSSTGQIFVDVVLSSDSSPIFDNQKVSLTAIWQWLSSPQFEQVNQACAGGSITLGDYRLVAWEWGFRPELLKYVLALKRQGAKLLWFKADLVVARSMYAKAHPEDPNCQLWDAQIQGIEEARLPTDAFQIVETFRNGMFRPHEELDDEILHST